MMYLHVPSAWTALLSMTLLCGASVAFLLTRKQGWDRAAHAIAEVAVVATGLTLLFGSTWGRAVWGTWWSWDPRLVSTAFLFTLLVAYHCMRGIGVDPDRAARHAAIVGVVGFLDVPIVHFSVIWWRSLHQQPTYLAPRLEPPPIDGRMTLALTASLATFLLFAAWYVVRRARGLGSHEPMDPVQPERARQGQRT